MPGYDTHYLFGINSFRRLPQSGLKRAVYSNKGAYTLGLLGPDIFFYYATEVVAARKNIGSIMHTTNTDIFFKNMVEYCDKKKGRDKEIAIAYLSGFLSHYHLDCVCHPYVYWKTDYLHKGPDYLEKHFTLETDIDIMMLKKYKKTNPYEFTKNSAITINIIQMDVVCDMLYYVIHRTYHDSRITKKGIRLAIISIKNEQKLLRLFSNNMKTLIGRIEKAFAGQRYLAPLIPGGNDIKTIDPLNLEHKTWFNPWDMSKSYDLSVPDMLNKSRGRYLMTIFLLENYLDTSLRHEDSFFELMNNIGGKSYHSGLDCRIPS